MTRTEVEEMARKTWEGGAEEADEDAPWAFDRVEDGTIAISVYREALDSMRFGTPIETKADRAADALWAAANRAIREGGRNDEQHYLGGR